MKKAKLLFLTTILLTLTVITACREKDEEAKQPCDKNCGYICNEDNTCSCPPGYYQIPGPGGKKTNHAACDLDTGQILKASLAGTPLACWETAHINDFRRPEQSFSTFVISQSLGVIRWNFYLVGSSNGTYSLAPKKYTIGEEYDEFETTGGEYYWPGRNRLCDNDKMHKYDELLVKGRYYHKKGELDLRVYMIDWMYGNHAWIEYGDSFDLKFTR